MKLQFVMGNIVATVIMGDNTKRTLYLPSVTVFKQDFVKISYKPIKVYGPKRKGFRKESK